MWGMDIRETVLKMGFECIFLGIVLTGERGFAYRNAESADSTC
jgi:hypothetical protein